MPRHPPYTLGKLDLLDRGSIVVPQAFQPAIFRSTLNAMQTESLHYNRRSTSPTGARAMPAQTERPYETIFQKQASQKSLILTRTSYLIVKEQPHFCGSRPPCGGS